MKRQMIKIDEDKCNGCGASIPGCPEGALQLIDGKARLMSDLFCDGLGACLGNCPQDAIRVEEREAEPYSEELVMENIMKAGTNTIKAHLTHLKSVSIVRMDVPCCGGSEVLIKRALEQAGIRHFVKVNVISIDGKII